ncbi:MAG: hypothetical protein ACRDTV_17590, partial [Mycobacterium sp.]
MTLMTIFDRFNITVVGAGAGLCGAAMALSPGAAAAPLVTGGTGCIEGTAGEAATVAPVAAGGPVLAGELTAAGGPAAAEMCGPAAAAFTDMAGVPLVAPGPGVVPMPAGVP